MKPFSLRPNEKLLTQAEKTIMFSDHYCCFAIPLYNTGIYSILAQFTIFGFVFGILSFSAPSILAIVLDFAYTAFFGILCLLVGSIQALGFFGVYKEKPNIFKKYFIGNVALLGLTFIYSLILLIISSTKHQTAIDQCLLQFVSNEEFLEGPSSTSQEVCSVWTYAQLGVCFFVWLLFCVSQAYFCYMVKIWGQDQRLDHIRYQSIISAVRQSQAASTLNPGLLEGGEGDEWESQSRAGSLDIRSSAYSGQSSHRNGKPVLNGGSRLKNEIEWKEIDPAILEDDHHHQHDQPSDLPVPTTPQQPSSSSSSSSVSRKQKFKELAPHDTNYYQQQQLQHASSSHSHSTSSHPRLPHHGQSPRLESNTESGHWIEVIDQPLSPNRHLADDQHDHAAYYSDSQQQVDDREYYRSKHVS